MPNFVVVTAFKSKDQMSADMKKMGMSAKNFGKIAGVSFRKATTSALSFKKVIGGILGAAILRRGFGALTQGVRTVAEEFVAFDDSITAAATKFGVFDRESETFKDLAKTAREVGAITEFTAPQAAEGLRFLAKAGWTAGQSMKALPSFVDLATASEMEFSRAADIATDVLGAFGLAVDDPTQRLENLTRVNDVMAKAVNMANIDMEDLFETMKFAGPIATTAGVSIEKFSAMAAFMGGAGIKASMGGTALRTMFLSLAAPTDKVRRKFKKLGIELEDSNGNLKDPIGILKQLGEGFKDMGTAQKTAALNLIFGKRAVSGAAVSMEGATKKLQEFEQSLLDSGGSSKKMAEAMRQSLGNRLEALKSGAIELGFKVLDAFAKKFPEGIDGAIAAVRKFDVKPIVQGIRDFVSALRTIRDILRSSIEFARDYKGLLVGIGAAFAAMRIVTVALAFTQIAKAFLIMKSAGGLVGALAAVGISATLGAIALAIGGIAAGVYTIYDNWSDLKIAFRDLLDWMESAFKSVGTSIAETWAEIFTSIKSSIADLLNKLGIFSNFANKLRQNDTQAVGRGSAMEEANWAGKPLFSTEEQLAWQGRMNGASSAEGAALPGSSFAAGPKNDSALRDSQRKQAKADRVHFQGQLNIAGAPEGSTYTQKSKPAPGIQGQLMGANP